MKTVEEMTIKAVDVLELWIAAGIAMAMQAANAKKLEDKEGENNG
jgi:hypothetical protein